MSKKDHRKFGVPGNVILVFNRETDNTVYLLKLQKVRFKCDEHLFVYGDIHVYTKLCM